MSPNSTTAVQAVNGGSRPVGTRLGTTASGTGALLGPGEALRIPPLHPHRELVLELACSVPEGTGDAIVQIVCEDHDGPRTLASLTVSQANDPSTPPRYSTLAIDCPQPHPLCLHLCAAGENKAAVVVHRLLVAPRHRLGRVNGLAGYRARLSNELQHFDADSYRHAMYGPDAAADCSSAAAAVREAAPPTELLDLPDLEAAALDTLEQISPENGEVAFNYSMRALAELLPLQPPDFLARADQLPGDGPLRVLSICAGAARIEEMILQRARRNIELTLMDASPDLAKRAAHRLALVRPDCTVTTLVGDVNRGLPGEGEFDVIMCVSALHHVADLETVFSHIRARLHDDGEFWSIGEQIGRNGNRLWPDDLAAANRAFARLPPRLRHNRVTGRVDEELDDRDFSTGCFEGIRSQELEATLTANLVPVHVYRRNVFLWRIVDATYGDNFQLTEAEDLACLRQVIAAEAARWATGGTSTELHGIYRKKTLQLRDKSGRTSTQS